MTTDPVFDRDFIFCSYCGLKTEEAATNWFQMTGYPDGWVVIFPCSDDGTTSDHHACPTCVKQELPE